MAYVEIVLGDSLQRPPCHHNIKPPLVPGGPRPRKGADGFTRISTQPDSRLCS
jgi:hypothetical protein